jgi:uncharacterized protein Yka (UPF0111/DUF47 family)
MSETKRSFATDLQDVSERYLDRVAWTVDQVTGTLELYRADRTEFYESVEHIKGLESDCDALLDEIRTTLGESMRAELSDIQVESSALLEVYLGIDEIVNRTEQFLADMAAMEPDLSETALADLIRMADFLRMATDRLATAVSDLLGQLCRPDEANIAESVTAPVTEIGSLESSCDSIRHKLIGDTFARSPTAEALLVRELAVTLDSALDAVEDAADQLLLLDSSAESDVEFDVTD